jgi:hypothetical protein
MKLNFLSLSLLSALLPAATANFDVYAVHTYEYGSGQGQYNWYGYSIFQNDPRKDDVNKARGWNRLDDVSGGHTGIRCKDNGSGCGVQNNPDGVQQMEMNFGTNPVWHWSEFLLIFPHL